MLKIYVSKVDGCEFSGYVYKSKLSPALLDKLNLTHNEIDDEIEVAGTFSTFASEDEGYVEDVTVTLYNDEKSVDLKDDDFNSDKLCTDLEGHIDFYEVWQDKMISAADHAYDCWKEDGFE